MLLKARYVLPVSSPHVEDGGVLVRDGRIDAVGTAADLIDQYPDEEVRDFGRAAILPGFVDVHTHLEFSALRGLVDDLPYSRWKIALSKREQALAPEDWDDAAYLGALEAIQSGITTIADITDTGASARAATTAGLRGVIYREVSTMRAHDVDDVMDAARADVDEWRESFSDSALAVGIAPHAAYTCHPRLYEAVVEYALDTELPVATHLAGSRDEHDFVKYGSSRLATDFFGQGDWEDFPWLPTGVSPVRYLLQWGLFDVPELLGVHVIHVDDDDVDVLARHDVAVASCPRCNAKLAMGQAPLESFFAHGMRVGLGTDSPASNNTIDFFDEMRIGLLLQRAVYADQRFLGAERYVRMATLEGANALGIDEQVGSLEPGKAADVIAVDLSHSHQAPIRNPYGALVHTCNQENVLFTMVEGRVLYDRGVYETLDSDRVVARADEMRSKLQSQRS
jgi:5-methylthioadenosine/S-adenosylhomocysteine deaminase